MVAQAAKEPEKPALATLPRAAASKALKTDDPTAGLTAGEFRH